MRLEQLGTEVAELRAEVAELRPLVVARDPWLDLLGLALERAEKEASGDPAARIRHVISELVEWSKL